MKVAIVCLFVLVGLAAALDKQMASMILTFTNNKAALSAGIDGAVRHAVNEKKTSGELPVTGYSIVNFSATKCGFSNGKSACTATTNDPLTGAKGTGQGLQVGTALKASLTDLFKNIAAAAQKAG